MLQDKTFSSFPSDFTYVHRTWYINLLFLQMFIFAGEVNTLIQQPIIDIHFCKLLKYGDVLDTWLLFLFTIFSSILFGLTARDQIAIKLENISNLIRDTYLLIEKTKHKNNNCNHKLYICYISQYLQCKTTLYYYGRDMFLFLSILEFLIDMLVLFEKMQIC